MISLLCRLAFRNLLRQKRRSIFTALTMTGGCFLLSLSLSVAEGSYSQLIEEFTRNRTGHVQIHAPSYLERPSLHKVITNAEELKANLAVEFPDLKISQRILSPALAYSDHKSYPASVWGVEVLGENDLTSLSSKIVAGAYLSEDATEKEVLVGSKLANALQVTAGDSLVLISQGADGSIANESFHIVGLIGEKGSPQAELVFLPLASARDFYALEGRAHEIAVVGQNYKQSESLATELAARPLLQDLDVAPWQRVEKSFYRSMQFDKASNNVSLFIIVLMVAIGVLNTILMSVLERTREYGVLKALGTRRYQIFSLIVLEMFFLSVVSSGLSVVLGYPVHLWFIKYGIQLPAPVDVGGISFDRITGELSSTTLLVPVAVLILSSVLVSLFPAFRAARLDPVKAIRSA